MMRAITMATLFGLRGPEDPGQDPIGFSCKESREAASGTSKSVLAGVP